MKGYLILALGILYCTNVRAQDTVRGEYMGDSSSSGDFSNDEDGILVAPTEMIECPSGWTGKNCQYQKFGLDFDVPPNMWGNQWPYSDPLCVIYGHSSIFTLDGHMFESTGYCTYRAFRRINREEDQPPFEIYVTRDPSCTYDDCVKEIKIIDEDNEITVTPEKTTISDGKFNIIVTDNELPFDHEDIKIRRKFNMRIIELLNGGVRVKFDERNSVYIQLVNFPEYSDGICGDTRLMTVNDQRNTYSDPSFMSSHAQLGCKETYDMKKAEDGCLNNTNVREACMILATGELSYCNYVINPIGFLRQCVREMCLCNYVENEHCLCDIATQYARTCSHANQYIGEWRESAPACVKSCEHGMEWTECGDESVLTCKAASVGMSMTVCVARCQCPYGTYFDEEIQLCVDRESCPCFYMDQRYRSGETRKEDCSNCICRNARWECDDVICEASAWAYGEHHYKTFDGVYYTHAENCAVLLAGVQNGDFYVYTYTTINGEVFKVQKDVHLATVYDNHVFHYLLGRDGRLSLHIHGQIYGTAGMEPVSIPEVKAGIVAIERYGERGFNVEFLKSKTTVRFDGIAMVKVTVKNEYFGMLGGLGGNFNGLKNDDLMLPSGQIASIDEFVDSWLKPLDCPSSTYLVEPHSCEDDGVKKICNHLIDSYHWECNTFLNLGILKEHCISEACGGHPEVAYEAACQFAKTVMSACKDHGVTNEALMQTYNEICPIICPPNKVYSNCSSDCISSCKTVGAYCINQCFSGCFCPDGTYENHDGSCVALEECSCFYNGEAYETDSITEFETETCTCNGGIMTCVPIEGSGTTCDGDLIYYDCLTTLGQALSCNQPFANLMVDACLPKCGCPPGLFMDMDFKCVTLKECGCMGADNKHFNPGESFMDDCNVCTCVGGVFDCTANSCPKVCTSSGGSHYQTFDGLMYDFHGECEYVLASDFCPNNPKGGLFSVVTKNVKCGNSGLTCSKLVIVTIKNKQIELIKGEEPVQRDLPNTRFRRAVTGYTDHREAEIFTVKQKGLFTEISTCIGITILWDNGTRVYVRLTPEYKGIVCGLCGNFDGRDINDFTASSGIIGDVIEFGNSWKLPQSGCKDATEGSQVNNTCVLNPHRKVAAEESCEIILDDKLFGDCHSKIHPKKFYDDCVLDTCGCDSGGDCECTCTAIANYAHQCAQKGVTIEWRNMKRCPLMCEIYNKDDDCQWHYRKCDSCITDTCCECQSHEDDTWCVEGCFPKCADGKIFDEMTQKCVSAENKETECTWYSEENMCRVCEPCNVCKTKEGAILRVLPGETKYFPLDDDTCEKETCLNITSGDLCYNGTIRVYDCEEEYKKIPEYNPNFYKLNCVNSTKSLCQNCRDCEKECIIREDTCDVGKEIGDGWQKVFAYDPVPQTGPKTYCVEYQCEEHPSTTEPVCSLQVNKTKVCLNTGEGKECEWWEELKAFGTEDPCCPLQWECVCVTCQHLNGTYNPTIGVGQEKDYCSPSEESNCCYKDICYEKSEEYLCPQIKKSTQPCPPPPDRTCEDGYIWINTTRQADCCETGRCECDSCSDFDIYNKRKLIGVGSQWNKNCLKFTCTRDIRGVDGCFEVFNYENVTCAARPNCPALMHSVITGKDQFDCCDTFQCECNNQCFVTLDGKVNAFKPNVEWTGDDSCYYRCLDPKEGIEGPRTNLSDCPDQDKICKKPEECPTCHKIVGEENDECGCIKFICEEIKRCPVIECSFPYQRQIIPSDPCKAPCYNCTCDHVCWDQFDNKTYYPEETWRRKYRTPERKCEDCICNTDFDQDGCLKEKCTPVPCEETEKCPSPYDLAVTEITECGCTKLIECKCMYCKLGDEVLKEKAVGSSWTEGDTALGCYDTYTCSNLKDIGEDLECFNVTKVRNPCPDPIVCPENYRTVKDEEKSCCYPDEECCDHYKCECDVCLFGDDEKAYQVGDTWTKDCKDYICTDTIDPLDQNKCYKETSTDVPCLEPMPKCNNCYKVFLKQERTVPEFCCDVYDCEQENVCKINGTVKTNGSDWYDYVADPNGCIKKKCFVTEEDYSDGKCPEVVDISPCMPDLTECEKCENKTIVDDICGCDKVTCPPLNPPVQCDNAKSNQRIVTLSTDYSCYPSKNCCICDNACVYKGLKKKLYETWWDEESCERLRCIVPTETITRSMPDVDENDWDSVKVGLDYRQMMVATRKALFIYDECEQEASLCPTVMNVGCPDLVPCKECQTTTVVKDKCNCDVNQCDDYICPPSPYNVTECFAPRSKLIEVSLNGLHEYFPCCPTGNKCVCPDGCYSLDGSLKDIGEEWDESDDSGCGSRRRFTCRTATATDENECPQIEIVPCISPDPCPNCFVTVDVKDEYCCGQVDCIKMTCNVTTPSDCEEKYFPFTVMKTDAYKTKNECCPHYCDCPEVCVDEFDETKHDKNEKWTHPNSECWDRFCLVDKTKVIKEGCPYIVNRTICVDPVECQTCYHKMDEIDSCGCTQRECEKNDCPVPECTNECKEIVDTGVKDDCDCPVLECRLKICPESLIICDNDEMDIYSWMDKKINKCCKQHGCRCNYTKCEEPTCGPNESLVRNVTVQKCCCPEYNCVSEPPNEDYCTYGGVKKKINERWVNSDNVCKEMQCTYENARSKKTKIEIYNRYSCMSDDGSRRKRATTCANYESPYWATTKNGCCRESVCPCTCQLYGDPHYTTFDGKAYDFQGKCTYTLMKETRFNDTEILVDNELCRWWSARAKDLSCLKTLTVLHKKSNYTFSYGQKFYFDGVVKDVNTAWVSDDDDIRIEVYGYKTLQMKIASLGIDLIYRTWSTEQSLIIRIPYETYEGQMAGMCGTCNNDQADDFLGRFGEKLDASDHKNIDKFGASWLSSYVKDVDHANCVPAEPSCEEEPVYPECPSTYPSDECINCENRCHVGSVKCSPCDEDPCEAITTNDVFSECWSEVDADSYLSQCQYDVALLTNSTEVKCDPCNSATIQQFAIMCEIVGLCSPWRSALNCSVPECPETQEFHECDKNSLKYRSCDNFTEYDDGVRTDGCFCPEGQLRKSANSNECIPAHCCFECNQPPTCKVGEPTTDGTNECGCPVYYCMESPEVDCSPKKSSISFIPKNGQLCFPLDGMVETELCDGMCRSSSSFGSDTEVTSTCTACKATTSGMSTKTINLQCGTETNTADIELHTECECQEVPCQ